MRTAKEICKPYTAYITDKERLAEIERALAEVTGLWELCGVMTDIYENELAGMDDKNTVIASRDFITSIIPLLQNYKGRRSIQSIRMGIYKYVIHKEISLREIQERQTLTAFVTDKKRLAEIEKALTEVTNYEELCVDVIGDIYNNELADNAKRDKIIVSLPFVKSIVPYVKNLEGIRICNVRNIRKGIDHYLFGKKRVKDKGKIGVLKAKYGTVHEPRRTNAYPWMDYIADEDRKKEIASALSRVKNSKMLCRDVILDVYTTELAGMEDKDEIIVSKRFVESLYPYMTNFQGKLTFPTIYEAIRKYVIFGDKERHTHKIVEKKNERPTLMDYIADDKRKAEIIESLAKATDLKSVGRVILDIYETDLARMENRRKIVVSKPFITSIYPLLKNFEGASSRTNFSYAIHKYVLPRNDEKANGEYYQRQTKKEQ